MAAFFMALISSRDVHAVMAVDPCGEPCFRAGAAFAPAAAANKEASPPPWMEISDQPKAGKFFQVRPQEGFRAITTIAGKAGISWRWIEASAWNRERYFDPRISDNLRPNGGITLTPRFAPFGSKTKPLTQRSGTGRAFPLLWLPRFAGDEPTATPVVDPGDEPSDEPSKDKPLRNQLSHLCIDNRVIPRDRRAKRFETFLRGDEVSIWVAGEGGCNLRSMDHPDDMSVYWSIGGTTFRLTDLCRQFLGGMDCDLPTLPSTKLLADSTTLAFPEIVTLSIKEKGRSAVGVAASSAIDAGGRLVDPLSVDLQIRDPFAPRNTNDVLEDWTDTSARTSDRDKTVDSACSAFRKLFRRDAVEALIPAFLGRSKAFRGDLEKRFAERCDKDGIASAIRNETRFLSDADKRETQKTLRRLVDTGTLDRYDELVLTDFPKGHTTADAERFRDLFGGYDLTCRVPGVDAEVKAAVGQAAREALLIAQRAREKLSSDRGRETGNLQRKDLRKAFQDVFLDGLKSDTPPAKLAKAFAILLRNLTATRNKLLWGQLEFNCRNRDPGCGGSTFAHTRPGQSKIFLCSQAVTAFGVFDKRKDELVNMVPHEAAHIVGVVDHDGNEEYVHKVVEWQSLPLFAERSTSGRLSMADGTSQFAIAAARK